MTMFQADNFFFQTTTNLRVHDNPTPKVSGSLYSIGKREIEFFSHTITRILRNIQT